MLSESAIREQAIRYAVERAERRSAHAQFRRSGLSRIAWKERQELAVQQMAEMMEGKM